MAQAQTAEPESRLARIERGIDRELANNLPVSRSAGGTFTIEPKSMGELLEFSKLMAVSDFCVRPAFRGNPGACLAVALQAFRCGGDPFAWANKAYLTKSKSGEEQISYESQLIHAIVTSSGVLQRRLRPVYEGEGTKRRCRIIGWIKGENEAFEYESPRVDEIAVKNSPLWTADRDQQLFYYATRAWARRYVPEILLGIYAPEELAEVLDIDPEPEPQRGDYIDHAAHHEPEPEPEVFAVVALDGELFEFEQAATAIDALRTVLAGARRAGRKMLEAAAENNEALIAQLGQAGTELLAEFAPPAPSETRTETPAPGVSPPAPPERAASSEPPARESAPAATSGPAEPAEPPTASPPAAAAAIPPAEDVDVGPQSIVPDDRRVPRAVPPTPGAASPATNPGNGAASAAPAVGGSVGPGPTAPTAASPTDERQSLAITVPLSRGKPDYRTFARGLLIPKIRQQTNGDDLAWLLGDNAENIEHARGTLVRQEVAELDEAIDAAWARLR